MMITFPTQESSAWARLGKMKASAVIKMVRQVVRMEHSQVRIQQVEEIIVRIELMCRKSKGTRKTAKGNG
jgi:hypothetical protein